MILKVNPDSVSKLAAGMKSLEKSFEPVAAGLSRSVGGIVGSTKSAYPESYVQSGARSAESAMAEIGRMATSIGDRLTDKMNTLREIAAEYKKAEERSKGYAAAKESVKMYKNAWGLFDKVVIGAYSAMQGYHFQVKGDYVHVYGSKTPKGFLGRQYIKWRKKENLMGTRYRYDNGKVGKYMDPKTAIKGDLSSNYNILKKSAWKNSLKGGGILGAAFTVGGSLYSYGWGENRNHGLASTEFASDLVVESAVMVGTTALGAAAGAGAGALAGAAFGSVVPGLGTAVGFFVGLGVGVFMSSDTGKAIKDWTKDKLNKGIEGTVAGVKAAGKALKQGAEFTGRVVGDAANAVRSSIDTGVKKAKQATDAILEEGRRKAADLVGKAAGSLVGGLKSLF